MRTKNERIYQEKFTQTVGYLHYHSFGCSFFFTSYHFSYQQANAAPEKEAVLRVDGTEIKTFPLSVGSETYTYTYKDPHGDYNLIEIAGDKIRIKEADCDDQICVRRGWASKNGETIVCLPHKLVIEVRSTDGSDEDSLIY